MSKEDELARLKTWLKFGAVGLLIVVGLPTACVMHHNQRASELLESGVSGVDVRCALTNVDADNTNCALSANANRGSQ